jgi:hypothetical protein
MNFNMLPLRDVQSSEHSPWKSCLTLILAGIERAARLGATLNFEAIYFRPAAGPSLTAVATEQVASKEMDIVARPRAIFSPTTMVAFWLSAGGNRVEQQLVLSQDDGRI